MKPAFHHTVRSKTMKTRNLMAALFVTAAFAPTGAHAASIGLNMSNDNAFPNFTLSDAEEALLPPDYFATDGYTNSGDAAFFPSGGNDFGTGTLGASGISVRYTSTNTWFAGAETSPAQQLHRAYIDDGDTADTGDVTFQPFQNGGDGIGVAGRITGLASYMAAQGHGAYLIRFYFTTDTAGATFQDVTILDGSQVIDTDGSDLFTADVLSTVPGTELGNGNYPTAAGGAGVRGFADSSPLNADNIVFYMLDRDGTIRGTLAGFRITTIPAPAALPAGLGLLTLVAMRRRIRRD